MDLLQGTLEMLVLRTLRSGALHGYGIANNGHGAIDNIRTSAETQIDANTVFE